MSEENSVNNIDDFAQKLKRQIDQKVLLAVHDKLIQKEYKIQAKHQGAGFDIKYSIKSRKPIVAMCGRKDGAFEIHLRPLHVASYANRFSELSEHIRNCCLQGKDCFRCGYCDKAYEYEYNGTAYVKCQFICFNFCFTEIEDCDVDSILQVLDMELEQIALKNIRKQK